MKKPVEDAINVPQIVEVIDSAISNKDKIISKSDSIAEVFEKTEDNEFPDECLVKYVKGQGKEITTKPSAETEDFVDYVLDDEIMPEYFKRVFSREVEEETFRYSPAETQEEVFVARQEEEPAHEEDSEEEQEILSFEDLEEKLRAA